MHKTPIDHSLCGHPRTRKARDVCRRAKAGLPALRKPRRKGHACCDHPDTRRDNAACNQRKRDERVWADDGPVVLEDLDDPDVRAKVRRIAAEQEARLELRLLAAGLHITQRAS